MDKLHLARTAAEKCLVSNLLLVVASLSPTHTFVCRQAQKWLSSVGFLRRLSSVLSFMLQLHLKQQQQQKVRLSQCLRLMICQTSQEALVGSFIVK